MMWFYIGIICFCLIEIGNAEGQTQWEQCGRWTDCLSQMACCTCSDVLCLIDSDCGWFNECFNNHCTHVEKKTKRSVCTGDNCSQNLSHKRLKRWDSNNCFCRCVDPPALAEQCAPILPPCFGDVECKGNHICIFGGCVPIAGGEL